MSYNRKAITDALSKMNKARKPKQPKDIIKDPEGQYKYPGVPTRIASDNITMQGVSYPVLGVDNLGNQQMMYPGAEYVFPGADYVDEFPIAKYGGLVTGLTNTPGNLLMNKKGKRMMAQSGSLSATNKMFLGNPMVTKRKKSVFVPGAPFQEGGNTSDPGMDAMMKARFAYAHMHGNPAAQRMTYPVDNPYIFTGTEPYTNPDMAGEFGTHYMFSQDNYAVPTIQQDEYGNLIYNPEANYTNPEAIQFDRPEDAEYFAEYYKQIAPGMQTGGSTDWKSRIASAMNFQKGGQLSKEEFEKRKAAYKKMTGRDFEPPKSFKPTQQSREYYQNRANQQPVVKSQPSETINQSRGTNNANIKQELDKSTREEIEERNRQRIEENRTYFVADTRSNAQRERDQFYANQLTDPNIYNQIGNFLDAGIAQAGNFWDYISGGDDWEKELENYKLQRLNPYVSDKDKLREFVNFGLSNTGDALMTGMEIADGYALARAIPGFQSQAGKYLTQGPLKNAYKINPLANRTPYGGRIHSNFGSEEAHWLTGYPSKETIHARMMESRPIQLPVPAEPSNFSFINKKGNLFSPYETSPLKGKLKMSSSENVLSKQNFWNKSEIDTYIKQQQTKNKMWDDLYKEYESIDPTGKKTPDELNDLFPHLKEKFEAIKNYSSINLDEKFLTADLKKYLGKNLNQYINNTGNTRNPLNRGHLLDLVGTLNATDFLNLSLYPSSINIGNKTLKFPNQQFLINTWEKGRLNQYGGIVTPPAMLGIASQYQKGGAKMSPEEFAKRKAAYKKLTGRDFEPPKTFKPSEKARQQYQEKYNQQPVVQPQSAETVNQSRGVDTKREKEIIEAQANTDAKAAENYMHFYNKTYGSDYGAISYEQALQKVRLPNFDKTKYLNMYNLGQPKNEQLQSFREEDQANRTWEVITNPFTAFEYAVATGNMANMPSNINAARMQGYDVGVTPGRNMVGNALNMTTNLFDAGDKVIRNVGEGNYLGAGLEAMRFLPGARMQTQLGKKIANTPRQLPGSSNTFKSILDNPVELETIRNNINLSNNDIVKLEKYLNEVYDYNNLTPFQKKKLLDRETYYLNKNNVSVDQRIQNNKNLLTEWENYKNDRIEYFNSPKFRERVNKQYGEMSDEIFKDFKEGLLQNLEKRPYIRPDVVSENAAAHYKTEPSHKLGVDDHKYGHTYYKDEYASDPRVVFHEGRHQLTNAEDELFFFPSRKEIEEGLVHPDLLKFDSDLTNPKTGADYFLSPEEFITRLDELKRDMSKVGYDYKNMDLTPEILKQYRGVTPNEAISQVIGKPASGVKLKDLSPEQYEAVIQLLDSAPNKTTDSQRLLRWFKDDFLLNQINNKWGLVPPAAIIATGAASQYQQGGSIQPLDYFDTELTDQEIEQYKKGGCVVVKL